MGDSVVVLLFGGTFSVWGSFFFCCVVVWGSFVGNGYQGTGARKRHGSPWSHDHAVNQFNPNGLSIVWQLRGG